MAETRSGNGGDTNEGQQQVQQGNPADEPPGQAGAHDDSTSG